MDVDDSANISSDNLNNSSVWQENDIINNETNG